MNNLNANNVKKFLTGAILLTATAGLNTPAQGQAYAGKSIFHQGQTRVSVTGGLGTAYNQSYVILGLGAGYYLLNGFELGLDAEAWTGNSPSIYKVSPNARYVFHQIPRFHPYVGAFYRRTFYEGDGDLDSYGGRAGAYARTAPNVYVGAGLVFETFAGCDDRIYSSCSTEYPEFTISVGF